MNITWKQKARRVGGQTVDDLLDGDQSRHRAARLAPRHHQR
jgi:hypothetical protein